MKYEALKTKAEKSFTVPVLDKGVNFGENSAAITDGQLAFCKNVWNRNGRLESRPGLCADMESIIGKDIISGAMSYSYFLTEAEAFIDGKYSRIATTEVYFSEANYLVYVFLVGEDRSVTDIGSMQFTRTDGNTFYIPENITFYVGKKQNGGGIFALTTLVNVKDFETRIYRIYEINADLNGWEISDNYYTPTVYINGRGNGYDFANQLDIAYTASPTELEPLNMLNGRFYAYYSSDSYSSSFRLPYSQLSNETVFCRIYQNSEAYTEWCILSGSDSETLDFCGQKVKCKIDREKGIVTFYVAESEFAVPQMGSYKENNIRIFAKKEIPDSYKKIVSCKHCTVLNSKTVFSGGVEGSEVYITRYDNPLYFPQITNNRIGSPTNSITAVASLENQIIAFKNTEIYSIEMSDEKPMNTTNLLIDNPSVFYSNVSLKIKTVSDTVGSLNKSATAKINGFLIWQTASGDICAFSDNTVYTLSNPIKPYLSTLASNILDTPVAVAWENYYILCFASKAVIMEFEKSALSKGAKQSAWYIWDFPEECRIAGAFSYNNKLTFLCKHPEKALCFAAGLYGEYDSVIADSVGSANLKNYDIEAVVKTKDYSLTQLGKAAKITKIYLQLEAKGDTYIKASSKDNFCDFKLTGTDICCNERKTVKLITNLKCTDSVNLSFKTSKPFSLGKSELYYTEINN